MKMSPAGASAAAAGGELTRMTASENRAPSGVVQASNATTFARVWAGVAGAFAHGLLWRLKDWAQSDTVGSELAGMSDRELRDLGINRSDIAALRAGTKKGGATDDQR